MDQASPHGGLSQVSGNNGNHHRPRSGYTLPDSSELVGRAHDPRVLVVDCDHSQCETLVGVLRELKYDAVGCSDLAVSRQLLAEPSVGLALVELRLGEVSGFELLREFRERSHHLEFIVTSAHLSPEIPVKAIHSGAAGYLFKPISREAVRHEVRRVLRVRELELEHERRHEALQRELEKRSRELLAEHGSKMGVQRGLINSLCRLTELRNPETGAHLHRMALYCREIALGLRQNPQYTDHIDDRFIQRLITTAPLHDIGKAGIPDSILLKRGSLNDDEFAVMKNHTRIGERILAEVLVNLDGDAFGMVEMGISICRSHHEKWDGTGYPAGLKGQDIPIEGRIASLADFYDALSSPRVYRQRIFSHEDIKSMIMELTGKHFDPAVAEAFFRREEEIIAVRRDVSLASD